MSDKSRAKRLSESLKNGTKTILEINILDMAYIIESIT